MCGRVVTQSSRCRLSDRRPVPSPGHNGRSGPYAALSQCTRADLDFYLLRSNFAPVACGKCLPASLVYCRSEDQKYVPGMTRLSRRHQKCRSILSVFEHRTSAKLTTPVSTKASGEVGSRVAVERRTRSRVLTIAADLRVRWSGSGSVES